MVADRMHRWLRHAEQKHGSGRIAAFSHGMAIKFLVTELFGYEKQDAWKTPIENTSLTIIRCDDQGYSLLSLNDYIHLEEQD